MKSLIVLAAVAALALGHAIANMPGAAASMRTLSAAQPVAVVSTPASPSVLR